MGSVKPDWLAQLAPEHAPPPAGWWPLAPGWWILLALSVLIIAYIIFKQLNPTVRLKRAALRQLKILESTVTDNIALARDLEHLLRRYAVARFGRDQVAGLSGQKWIAFIIEHGGNAMAGDTGTNLLRAAYGGTATVDRTGMLAGARAFMKRK